MRALLVALLFTAPAYAGLKAGTATIDVTPEKFPVLVNGMFTERVATAALDRLHARALVLDDGSTRLAIVVVDSCMMPREFLDKAKDLASKPSGIVVENMCISATHTHSAPAVMGCLGCDADPVYPAFLQTQIVRAITQAAKNLVPAKAGWSVTHAPNYTFNRRWILRSDKIRNDPFGNPTVRAMMHPATRTPTSSALAVRSMIRSRYLRFGLSMISRWPCWQTSACTTSAPALSPPTISASSATSWPSALMRTLPRG